MNQDLDIALLRTFVAIVDTGVDWNHRNIDWENFWFNQNGDIGRDFFEDSPKPWDFDGHGTMVAGLIAGSWKDKDGIAGINPFARLMILKAVNNFGHTRASYVAQAIAYAADNGARVINLSVGGENVTEIETAAIDYAYSKGVVMVVAAGNEGADISKYGMAASDKVLVVAATGLNDQRAPFSNWGKISVAAPGVDILSLRARRTDTMLGIPGLKYAAGANFVGEDKRYYHASGTSFAAPLVTGLASLHRRCWSFHTNMTSCRMLRSLGRQPRPGPTIISRRELISGRSALLFRCQI